MKFVRRPDLDPQTRLWMAMAVRFRGFGDWGAVAELAREHGVSRQFLYQNEASFPRPFAVVAAPRDDLADESLHQLVLAIRLRCKGSLDGIAGVLDDMGWSPGSVGHISEFLRSLGAACPREIPRSASPVTLLLDETFANSLPILVVMEASSHCVLSIKIMPDRKAETWVAALLELMAEGVDIGLLVKDQGASLKAAARELGLPERADLFHLLKPFDPFLPHFERRAYGAVEEEAERLRVLGNRKSEASLAKARAKIEAAALAAAVAIRDSDSYDYLHKCLHESFDSFTEEGVIRAKTVAEGDLEAATRLLEEQFPSHNGILAAVKFLRKNLPDYWGYFEQLEAIVRRHARAIPEHTLRAACLAWQLGRKSVAVKSPRRKKELARQSKAWLELALTGDGGKLRAAVEALHSELDANVRSSSPLEAINSVIREHLNACRGQTTQEALSMLAFFLNHRKATRGKYAGSSPHERLTGMPERGSPIAQLLALAPRASKWVERGTPTDAERLNAG